MTCALDLNALTDPGHSYALTETPRATLRHDRFMTPPRVANPETYWWLDGEQGGLAAQSSCFTFARSLSVSKTISSRQLIDVREVDLAGSDDPVDNLVAQYELDTAVFDGGDEWTVMYQYNCSPYDVANHLLATPAVDQAVVLSWNVDADTEFAFWQKGEQVVLFAEPHDRQGSDPDRLNDMLKILGIPISEPSDEDVDGENDSWFATHAQLMALAESITGLRLTANFLARRVQAGRTS